MGEYRTDEETIELVKRWWKDNGKQLLLGLALVIAVVVGYRYWQDHSRQQNELASQRFHEFANTQGVATDAVVKTRSFLYQQIKDEHSKSGYAPLAALLEAQRLASTNQFIAASKELEWALSVATSPHMQNVIRLRLARVQWAQGEPDKALNTLQLVGAAGFAAELAEMRGDISVARGDRAGAYAAYQQAIKAQGAAPSPLLEIKRDDVAPAAGVAAAPGAAVGRQTLGAVGKIQ